MVIGMVLVLTLLRDKVIEMFNRRMMMINKKDNAEESPICIYMMAHFFDIYDPSSYIEYMYDDGSEEYIDENMGILGSIEMQYAVGKTTPFLIPKGINKIGVNFYNLDWNVLFTPDRDDGLNETAVVFIPEDCKYCIAWEPSESQYVSYYLAKLDDNDNIIARTYLIKDTLHVSTGNYIIGEIDFYLWEDDPSIGFTERRINNGSITYDHVEWEYGDNLFLYL